MGIIMAKQSKVKYHYHITTKTDKVESHYFCMAENHKKALVNLQTKSFDYKNIVRSNDDVNIDIKIIA